LLKKSLFVLYFRILYKKLAYFKIKLNIYRPCLIACFKVFASNINPLVIAKRSPVFNIIRIVTLSLLKYSLIYIAITLRLLFEVADKNTKLLVILFFYKIFKR
jgi:hypothetical protein